MKLILLSKHLIPTARESLEKFLGKSGKEIKIGFCENAADLSDDKPYVEIALEELNGCDYELIDFDLRKYSESNVDELRSFLQSVDATFFTGGDFHYLMNLVNKSGLSKFYKEFLEDGLIHIGFSAGAIICSHDMKYYDQFDSKVTEAERPEKGLGFFPYYIFPHYYNKIKYTGIYEKSIKKGYKNLIALTDNQAIIVENGEWQIVQD